MNIEDSILISQGLAPIGETRRSWLYVICLDGGFVSPDTKIAGVDCSLFTQGVGFRLVISLKGAVPYMWREQCGVIKRCQELLEMPEESLPHWDILYRQIELLAAKNHYPGHSQVILSVWTEGDEVHYLMQQYRLERNVFDYNDKPVFLMEYDKERLPMSPYNGIPRPSMIHHLAHRQALNNNPLFQGSILRDFKGDIVQSTLGNVFVLVGDSIYTTNVIHGALLDSMFETIEFEASQQGMHVIYTDGLSPELVAKSTECMVASCEHGIHLVVGLGDKRYQNTRFTRLAVYIKQRLIY